MALWVAIHRYIVDPGFADVQWHLQTHMKKHKYSDIVIKRKDNLMIVLELLATGDTSFVQSQIQKTPKYMAILSGNEVLWLCYLWYQPPQTQ